MNNQPTTSTTKKNSLRVAAATLVAILSITAVATTTAPAGAATNRWYAIPTSQGASGNAIMTYFNKGYASGTAGGQIYLNDYTNTRNVYVQIKPNEGGLWKQATQYRSSGAAYYNWSDSFTLNYSGFMFRICKDLSLRPDSCGAAVQIAG